MGKLLQQDDPAPKKGISMDVPPLDQRITIKDLLDLDLLREVINSFSNFFGIKIRLLDEEGVDFFSSPQTPRFCQLIKEVEKNLIRCQEALGECGWVPLEEKKAIACINWCGASYFITEVASQLEVPSRVIFGPFRTSTTVVSFSAKESLASPSHLNFALEKLPAMELAEVKKIAEFFTELIDIFLFLSAKRLYASRLHLDKIYRAREEIFKEMESQMRSPEDKAEIEKLKQIF